MVETGSDMIKKSTGDNGHYNPTSDLNTGCFEFVKL